jgi:hypothetical protein
MHGIGEYNVQKEKSAADAALFCYWCHRVKQNILKGAKFPIVTPTTFPSNLILPHYHFSFNF